MSFNKRGRKVLIIMVLICAITFMYGCDLFTGIDLSEEDSELIAEYAAGLLRKYDTHSKLKEPKEEADTETVEETVSEEENPVDDFAVEEPSEPLPEDTSAQSPEEPDFAELTEDLDVEETDAETPDAEELVASTSTIAGAYGIEDCDISFIGYDLCDKYPDNEDNSWLISMAASEGKKLCVLRFNITNTSDSETMCDILTADKSYRLIINDDQRLNEKVTVLPDSFSQFCENIAPGDTYEAVLVFEPSSELADSISSLKLVIKDSDNSETIEL